MTVKVFYLLTLLILINLNCNNENAIKTDNDLPTKNSNISIDNQPNLAPTFPPPEELPDSKTSISENNNTKSKQRPYTPTIKVQEIEKDTKLKDNKEEKLSTKKINAQKELIYIYKSNGIESQDTSINIQILKKIKEKDLKHIERLLPDLYPISNDKNDLEISLSQIPRISFHDLQLNTKLKSVIKSIKNHKKILIKETRKFYKNIKRPKHLKNYPWDQNNCYITSGLSAIIPVWVSKIGLKTLNNLKLKISKNPNTNKKALIQLIDIMFEMYDKENDNKNIKTETLIKFRKLAAQINPEFNHMAPEDCVEYLNKLIELSFMHELNLEFLNYHEYSIDENRAHLLEMLFLSAFDNYLEKESIFVQNHLLLLENRTTCVNCKKIKIIAFEANCRPFALNNNVLLDGFHCQNCGKNNGQQETKIINTPNIILVNSYSRQKNSKKTFSLNNYKYELKSCIICINDYHCFSYIYDSKSKNWFIENDYDKDYKAVSEAEVLNHDDQIILIYEKVDN